MPTNPNKEIESVLRNVASELDRIQQILNEATRIERIKPEPKLRPWKPEEVPVGAEVRFGPRVEHSPGRWLISRVSQSGLVYRYESDTYSRDWLLKNAEWKWPQDPETAWQPCGVMEGEA